MNLAGIDTNCYKAHTTRGVGPSIICKKGASPGKILEQGDWRNVSTFFKHYNRESEDSPAGRLILEATGRKRN